MGYNKIVSEDDNTKATFDKYPGNINSALSIVREG
jgi:hypothetical protein